MIAGLLWGQFVLGTGTFKNPTPNNLTTFSAIETAGFYTLVLYPDPPQVAAAPGTPPCHHRARSWDPQCGADRGRILGLRACFRRQGVAASSNLLLDWLITMPWYIGMVILFVRGQNRSRFPPIVLFFLCGCMKREQTGWWAVRSLPWISGHGVSLLPAWAFLLFIAFWEFILVYSSMILPAAWVIATASPADPPPHRLWRDALLPLVWLFPYTVYLVLVLIAIGHR